MRSLPRRERFEREREGEEIERRREREESRESEKEKPSAALLTVDRAGPGRAGSGRGAVHINGAAPPRHAKDTRRHDKA